jgi:hypothetical protein
MTRNFLKAEFHPAYAGTPAMPTSIPARPRTRVADNKNRFRFVISKESEPEFKGNARQINLQFDSDSRMIATELKIC